MAAKKYIVIPGTDIRLYENDIVKISNKPKVDWIVHYGWFYFQGKQTYGWYFVSTETTEVLPAYVVDLTLCTLKYTKTVGSEICDGKVTEYADPFTEADAELLKRTFITVDTIDQRDNIDPKSLVNGKMVRVNYVDGVAKYYAWDEESKTWVEGLQATDISYTPPASGTTSGSRNTQEAIDALNDAISSGDKEVFYGTTEYWNNQPQLIPIRGCLYIYSDHTTDSSGTVLPGIKIGDGSSYLIDMPFVDKKYADHILDTLIHVSASDRSFWDNKVRCYLDPNNTQRLVFTTD